MSDLEKSDVIEIKDKQQREQLQTKKNLLAELKRVNMFSTSSDMNKFQIAIANKVQG